MTLPSHADLRGDLAHVSVERAAISLPSLRGHRFDPGDGLDIDEVAMLAVVNNGDLKAARNDARIARAQAFSTGLLPDPLLGAGYATAPGGVGTTSAFNLGLTVDLLAIMEQPGKSRVESAETARIDLTLLWQEWQTVSQARLMFVKVIQQESATDLLRAERARLDDRYQRTRIAVERGLITSEAVTPHLAALQDVDRQLNDLERQRNQSRHDLNLLVGLAPELHLDLVSGPEAEPLDEAEVRARAQDLSDRRPDLVALRYGFEAEDERYRSALLAQFPSLVFGPTLARDTSGVKTVGIAATIGLPIFNRNRGAIAVEIATRQKLRDDYQARLNSVATDVDRLLHDQLIIRRQLAALAQSVAVAELAAARADVAFQSGNIDALSLTNIETALLARRLERLGLEQASAEQRIALVTILGGDLAPAAHERAAP
jgi:outer membrane protein TolC